MVLMVDAPINRYLIVLENAEFEESSMPSCEIETVVESVEKKKVKAIMRIIIRL